METKTEYLSVKHLRIGETVLTPNGVGKIEILSAPSETVTIEMNGYLKSFEDSEIKPILRRLDSMTEVEKSQFKEMLSYVNFNTKSLCGRFIETTKKALFSYHAIDWLDANGFDRPRLINGVAIESLIEAGLAVDAATLEKK